MSDNRILEGRKDRYQLDAPLGRGANGVTWRARRLSDGREVCAKEVRWATMIELDDERRFHREAGILAALDHHAIPDHIDDFTAGEGMSHALWLVQELVPGVTIEAERKTRGYLESELRQMLLELARVLVFLHDRHPPVVHRDIKPSNIMRRPDGRLVLLDFGAALLAGLDAERGATVAGTFGFMAPEQIRGQAGPASDVYALGMVIASIAAGAIPEALLDGDNRPSLVSLRVSLGLRKVLDQMLLSDPRRRPSAAQIIDLLQVAPVAPRALPPRHVPSAPTPQRVAPAPAAPAPKHEAAASAMDGLKVFVGIVGVIVALLFVGFDRSAERARNEHVDYYSALAHYQPASPASPAAPLPRPRPTPPAVVRVPIAPPSTEEVTRVERLCSEHNECDALANHLLASGTHDAARTAWQRASEACLKDETTCSLALRLKTQAQTKAIADADRDTLARFAASCSAGHRVTCALAH